MLTGNALYVYKQRALAALANYQGLEAREQQLVTDVQIANDAAARPDDIRQALAALKDDGLAHRRVDDTRGPVWKITPDGLKQAARLALETDAT
jgi:UDP-N-acetylmuramate-alanine ligase